MEEVVWELEPGNFEIGENPCVGIVEIGDYTISLPKELYGIKGKLYTGNRGIEKLVRNTLRAGLKILFIVGDRDVPHFLPRDALLCLKRYGVDERGMIRHAKGFCPVIRLPRDMIETFRKHVEIVDLMGIPEPLVEVKIREELKKRGLMRKARIKVKYIKPKYPIFPYIPVGLLIRAKDLVDAWMKVVEHVYFFGGLVETRRGQTKEVLCVMVIIDNPEPTEFPNIKQKELEEYWRRFWSEGEGAYTYGERILEGKFTEVLSLLAKYKNTRRACVVLWQPEKDVKSENPPCLCFIQFFIRQDKLHMVALFRSHDVLKAYPHNLYALAKLMKIVAKHVGVELGKMIVISTSAHIYVDDLTDFTLPSVVVSSDEFIEDEYGYLEVRREGNTVKVIHYTPSGEKLREYMGTEDEIARVISRHCQALRPEHYIWLGRELERGRFGANTLNQHTKNNPQD